MQEAQFIENLCRETDLPGKAEVLTVRTASAEDQTRELKRLIGAVGRIGDIEHDRSDWVRLGDRTIARLPLGGLAEVHHASGAMRVKTGIAPMEQLIGTSEKLDKFKDFAEGYAKTLGMFNALGRHEQLDFERLWRIKAAATDRKGKKVHEVLCRTVAAYRQFSHGLPILGGASLAIKTAAKGALDSIATRLLTTEPEPIASVRLVDAADAARAVYRQLEGRFGGQFASVEKAKINLEPLKLGYLHLGKRKAHRVLAPHYLAYIQVEAEEAQAFQLVTPATEVVWQPLCLSGHDSPIASRSRADRCSTG